MELVFKSLAVRHSLLELSALHLCNCNNDSLKWIKRINEAFLVVFMLKPRQNEQKVVVSIISLHNFTGRIPEILIFHRGKKDDLLFDVIFRWQSLQIPVTCLKNDLWMLSKGSKPLGQGLLSCSVLWRTSHIFCIGKYLVSNVCGCWYIFFNMHLFTPLQIAFPVLILHIWYLQRKCLCVLTSAF